jgi:hypothetical protein
MLALRLHHFILSNAQVAALLAAPSIAQLAGSVAVVLSFQNALSFVCFCIFYFSSPLL